MYESLLQFYRYFLDAPNIKGDFDIRGKYQYGMILLKQSLISLDTL